MIARLVGLSSTAKTRFLVSVVVAQTWWQLPDMNANSTRASDARHLDDWVPCGGTLARLGISRGSEKQTAAPLGDTFLAQIFPPCRAIISRQIDRPSPVPPAPVFVREEVVVCLATSLAPTRHRRSSLGPYFVLMQRLASHRPQSRHTGSGPRCRSTKAQATHAVLPLAQIFRATSASVLERVAASPRSSSANNTKNMTGSAMAHSTRVAPGRRRATARRKVFE